MSKIVLVTGRNPQHFNAIKNTAEQTLKLVGETTPLKGGLKNTLTQLLGLTSASNDMHPASSTKTLLGV